MMAIKRNVIPLLGKNIQDKLKKKLVTSQVQKIYIALDKDAIKTEGEDAKKKEELTDEIFVKKIIKRNKII